ncbi:hypothetical protein [Brevibacterium casei]|uniref:hypothetical protein n=1 Tax=Brevibacterium casei TaxID=33889 RepID=UPI00223ACEAE|nr:hypothetical protein [Brevibacterium casei]MCT1551779.1 hypothetical protein [Brevibacterium casei]MCT1561366.1 hypothetical protein [Brevibacterium casei]MCT2209544.1 hypothetical protein [Brevibacterium casei]
MSARLEGDVAMTVMYMDEHELASRKSEILDELHMTLEELERNAGNYMLDAGQRDLYREYHILVSLSED